MTKAVLITQEELDKFSQYSPLFAKFAENTGLSPYDPNTWRTFDLWCLDKHFYAIDTFEEQKEAWSEGFRETFSESFAEYTGSIITKEILDLVTEERWEEIKDLRWEKVLQFVYGEYYDYINPPLPNAEDSKP